MKKIYLVVLTIFTALLLVACAEITDDYNKAQEPSIELTHEGELNQIYDENKTYHDVKFTVKFDKFDENNIDESKVTIKWYTRGIHREDKDNSKSYTQTVNSPGEIDVKVVVSFKLDGADKELEAHSLINVVKEATKLTVTNSLDSSSHRVSAKLGSENNITFTGTVVGNLKVGNLRWTVEKQVDQDLVLIKEEKLNEDDLVVTNNQGKTEFTYNFNEAGSFVVKLQAGEGDGLDANVMVSNSTHIEVNYGDFELKTLDSKIMTNNYDERLLTVNELDESVGNGTYEWYLNGEKLDNDNNLTYVHDNNDLGSYIYQVKFNPSVKNELDVIETDPNVIETDPILVLNGILVNNEEELLLALEENIQGIVFAEDIVYTGKETINLSNVALYGNGHKIESKGIMDFFEIGDNVVMANMVVENSNRYSIHVKEAKNIYFEDIKLSIFGDASPTSMLDGDFSAGIYIDRSEAVIKNVEFLTGGLVGIRLDQHLNTEGVTKLTLYGEFKYSDEDVLYLPVASGKSGKDQIEFNAKGFDYFALPGGEITIRRWDNQGDPISWEIYNPDKTVYEQGDYLDLNGVGINVNISFLEGIEIDGSQGLSFVKLYIFIFKQYGILEITDMAETDILETYYIVGELDSSIYGNDRLFYSQEKDLKVDNPDLEPIKPELPQEPGDYKLKIYIGEEFYLGHIIITIKD